MLFRLNKYILFTLTTLLLAAFFVVDINKTNAAFDPAVTYAKPINGQLSADEWNNLKLDFLNTWGNTTAKGGIGIGIAPRPVDFNGLLASSTITTFGGFIGSLNATNISAGNFGTNYSGGGGIWGFPYGKLGVSYSANEMQPGTATFAVNGNVGIGTTTPGALFHVNGTSLFSGSASFDGSVNINTDPDFNSSGFEYGNGFDPSVGEYFNERFRVNSFFESPFLSMGVAQNYLLYTENFEYANWVQTNIAAFSANGILSPTGVKTAEIIPAGTNAAANISQVITNNVQGDWSAGIWVRSQSGPATIKIRIDSSAQTGDEKSINIDERWRFYSVGQNFNAAHTTKTFRIITGTNSVSLWGARMNPGAVVNAYFARTSSALPTATPGVFFNNNVVYASTFSGSLSGNAASATYATYGSYAGFSLSNNVDNANKWLRIGSITLTYNSTYRFGQSWNVEFNIKENTNDPNRAHNELDNAQIVMRGTMRTVTGSADFNTAIPSFSVELNGSNLSLTPDDIAMQVDSSTTVAKVVSLYVRLKDANTNYVFAPVNRYGASYSSSGSVSGSYCTFSIPSQVAYVDLPTSAQDSAVYATAGSGINLWKLNGNSIHSLKSFVGINTTTPQSALDVVGQIKMRESTITQPEDVINKGYLDAIVFPSSTPAVGTQSGFWTAGAANSVYNNNSGNVGIGTSNPLSKFTIQQGTSAFSQLSSAFDMALGITSDSSKISGVDFKNFNSSGQVRLMARNDQDDYLVLNTFGSGNTTSFFGQQGKDISAIFSQGAVDIDKKLAIGTYNAGDLILGTSNTERMRILSSGNVGIGNANPGSLLSIGATAFDLTAAGTMYSGATTTRYVDLSGALASSISVPNDIYSSAGSLKIAGTGNSYVMGNMGVGTTNPQVKFQVQTSNTTLDHSPNITDDMSITRNAMNTWHGLFIGENDWAVGGVIQGYYANTPSYYSILSLGTRGWGGIANTLNIKQGSVGIGTTDPGTLLDIKTTVANAQILKLNDPSNRALVLGSYIAEGANDIGADFLKSSSIGEFRFRNTVLTMMTMKSNGNVGIGTTTPTAKLEVNGTFKVAGPLNSVVLEKLSGTGSRIVMTDSSGSLYATSSSVATGLPSSSVAGQTLRSDGSGWLANSNIFNNGTRVGIGTTTPTAKLEVDGTFSTNDNARIGSLPLQYPYRRVDSYSHDGTGYYWGFGVNSGGTQKINSFYVGASRVFNTVDGLNVVSWIANEFNGGTPEYSKAISLNASGSSYFNGGNVGVGTTTPGSLLTLGNAFALTSGGTIYSGATTTRYVDLSGVLPSSISVPNDIYSSDGNLKIAGTGNSYVMGNMGVGTTNPNEKLRILSAGNSGLKIGSTGSSNYSGILFEQYDGTNQVVPAAIGIASNGSGSTASKNLYFAVGSNLGLNNIVSVARMTINGISGNVGIGTTAPNEQLEITKNFRLPSTSGTTPYGIIYKDNTRFIHDFNYGLNGNGITTVGRNTFVGLSAGNLAMGSTATSAGDASYNTGIGSYSLSSNTTGYQNTANGYQSLYFNTTGSNNTANGMQSLFYNTTGSNNTANGYVSLFSNTTGNYNTALGMFAGRYIANGTTGRSTGNYGLYLGHNSKASADGTDNEIVIGYNAIGKGSNTASYGNSSMAKHIFEAGNVGIGTTTPTAKLEVNGTFKVAGPFNSVVLEKLSGTGSRIVMTDSSGSLYATSSSVATGLPSSSIAGQTLRSDGSGWLANSVLFNDGTNVGIGITSPTAKLHVIGDIRTPNNSKWDFWSSGPTSDGYILGGGNGYVFNSYNATNGFNFTKGSPGTSLFFINSSGNVGIGNTTPGALLSIGNAFDLTAGGVMYSGATTTRYVDLSGVMANGISVPNDIYSSAGNLKIAGTGNSYVMGNMGVGATTPTAKLDVRLQASSVGDVLSIGNSNSGVYGKISIANVPYRMSIIPTGQVSLALGSNGAERMRIDVDGNVGIGTTTPTAKLEVNGTFKVAGPFNSVVLEKLSGTGSRIVMTDSDGSLYATSSSIATGLPAASGIAGQTLRSDGVNWVSNSNIFNNGTNVGIGITDPVKKLHINGEFLVTNNSLGVTANDGFVFQMNSSADAYLGNRENGKIYLYTNNSLTRGITIEPNLGNIGIGNTSPGALLAIGNAFNLTASGIMYSGATTTRYVDLSGVMANGISVPNDIYSSGGSLKIAGTANSFVMGNFGVGTTNPTYKLDTVGTFRAAASSSSIILNADGDVLIGI